MERLYTPWRATYVNADDRSLGCFLCQKPAERRDEENLILYRGATAYIAMNLYPYNTGHLMIAPYQHTGELVDLPNATAHELMALTQRCVRVLNEEYHPDGYNAGMNLGVAAGAGAPEHVHMHVVPRWLGDTNFMPVLSETKVLPESLEQTFAKLKPHFS